MLTALVLGGAANVLEEAEEALKLFDPEPDAIFCCNDTIPRWPGRVDYICTLHPEKLEGWLKSRRLAGYPMGAQIWSYKNRAGSRGAERFPLVDKLSADWAGSSGLYMVRVAILEKFERIVLAGVPMAKESGHVLRAKPWAAAKGFHNGWKKKYPEIKHRVRSMSGWTKELLGAPTEQWVRGGFEPNPPKPALLKTP